MNSPVPVSQLVAFIESHGHRAHAMPDGRIMATCQEVGADRKVREVSEEVTPTFRAVREWLGY